MKEQDEDDVELSYTEDTFEKDDDETIGLIDKPPPKKKRSWCKCALLAFAITLTAVALVQLADSYGAWLEVRVFPPIVVSAAHVCRETVFEAYEVEHSFQNNTHTFQIAKPFSPFVLMQPNVSWAWNGDKIVAEGDCFNLIVFSI